MLESLAEAAHEVFWEGCKPRFSIWSDKRRKAQNPPYLVAYAELPENMKEDNRQNVRDIPAKLAAAGYVMIPARSNEPPFNFPADLECWLKQNTCAGCRLNSMTAGSCT